MTRPDPSPDLLAADGRLLEALTAMVPESRSPRAHAADLSDALLATAADLARAPGPTTRLLRLLGDSR